jgi:hypothetical protein
MDVTAYRMHCGPGDVHEGRNMGKIVVRMKDLDSAS